MDRIDERLDADVLVLAPRGRFAKPDAAALARVLFERAAMGARRVAIDLSGADLVDAARELLGVVREFRRRGKAAILVGPNHAALTRELLDWGAAPLCHDAAAVARFLARPARYVRPLATAPAEVLLGEGEREEVLLMVGVAPPDLELPVTRIGGPPLLPPASPWPACPECGRSMQVLGQIALDFGDALLPVWRCTNLGRGCESVWRPRLQVVARAGLARCTAPPLEASALQDALGLPELDEIDGVAVVRGAAPRTLFHERRTQTPPYEHLKQHAGLPVLGKLGGAPDWLQAPEVPECPRCSTSMAFVAQLDESGGGGIDFGGGLGYVFACRQSGCAEGALVSQR